ncbi:hypothetical protein GOBAR_DD18152 [Gossypium barbadense]|nr:hypothetical protein GOBAR_DD18152 [Gossypium barbadense]
MPPREEFPTKGLEGAPSNDIGVIRESMMNVLKESNTKKIDKKRRKDEFLSQLTEEEDEHEGFIDEVSAIRQATRESIQSQHEWHRREEFRRSTGGWDNIYEEGRSSHGSAREHNRERTSKSIPASSPWLYNLIQVATEVGQGVKLPTPYEVSDVYLESDCY